MKRLPLFILLLVIAICAVGCAKGDKKPTVTGKVTFDGAPLAEGSIGFLDPAGGSYDAAIKDGAYAVQVPAGEKKVRIISNKQTGTVESDEGDSPIYEQIIPARYNDATELTFSVPAKGGEANFDLTSN